MTEVLRLLSDLKFVHCDIKPDNILVQNSKQVNGDPFCIKVIDFGSAFSMKEEGSVSMATPEYVSPEVLRLIANNRSGRSSIEELANTIPTWAVDIWSLGAILLEIITGVPLWMSLRCSVDLNGKKAIRTGLFAVKGRAYDKIQIRQKAVAEELEKTVWPHMKNFKEAEMLLDLLGNMMQWDPKKRISPKDLLNHPYMRG